MKANYTRARGYRLLGVNPFRLTKRTGLVRVIAGETAGGPPGHGRGRARDTCQHPTWRPVTCRTLARNSPHRVWLGRPRSLMAARTHRGRTNIPPYWDEGLATVAHELRNPLATILLALQTIPGDRTASRPLAIAEHQARQAVRIIDDLFDVLRRFVRQAVRVSGGARLGGGRRGSGAGRRVPARRAATSADCVAPAGAGNCLPPTCCVWNRS